MLENTTTENTSLKAITTRIAIDCIVNKQNVTKEIKENYKNEGSFEQEQFEQLFAKACAEQTAIIVEKDNSMFNIGVRLLHQNIRILDDRYSLLAMESFIEILKEKTPQLFDENKNLKIEFANDMINIIIKELNIEIPKSKNNPI